MGAGFRFASLWLSQVCRIAADHCLRVYVILLAAARGPGERDSAWHLVVALFALPPILLAPLIGALANSLPKGRLLAVSAAWCAVATLPFLAGLDSPIPWLAVVAVGSAAYMPTRYALLPAASTDTRIPLPRINGWIEMGAVTAIIAGMFLAGVTGSGAVQDPLVAPAPIAAFLGALAVVAALPVRFAADIHRRESRWFALEGFFRDCKRLLSSSDCRGYLIAWGVFRGVVAAITGAFVAVALAQTSQDGETLPFAMIARLAIAIMAGAVAGSFIASVQGHPRRSLGLIPLGVTGMVAVLVGACLLSEMSGTLAVLIGFFAGWVNVPLLAAYQDSLPADARGNGVAMLNTINHLCTAVMAVTFFVLANRQIVSPYGQIWLVTGITLLGAIIAWKYLYRETLEQIFEIILWPMYRIRAFGPGKDTFPKRGAALVVANHSAWMDPLWVGKVIPRRLTPMMTSVFFDLPVMKWLMVHVVRAIRVQASTYRREVPELRDAIAALDRGEVVVIFPEGMLRRRTEQPLRQFGQGVWHILQERPQTPVVVCWIEGGWGSYMSFYGGPPTKNKRPDWWRPIHIALDPPNVLDPDVLKDDRTTRGHLMHACLGARRWLNLPEVEPVAPFESDAPSPAPTTEAGT